MAERIVSPGVFTRERDLSFLPVGIGEIGAAIIGPTRKGPSFVPTVIRSFADFEAIFGTHTKDYYTSYTVREYLKSAGSVTIVKVGHIGGYSAGTVNLVVAESAKTTQVVATFAPSAANNSGVGSISASIDTLIGPAGGFDFSIMGTNATASLTDQSVIEGAGITGQLFSDTVGADPLQPYIGASAAPAYLYKDFRSSISASKAAGYIDKDTVITSETQASGLDFAGATNSVNATTYVTTLNGNVDAQAARTPFIKSQAPPVNLFRVYMRVDGYASNGHYVVISDIKKPANSNSSPDYAMFSLNLYTDLNNLFWF